MNPKNAQRDPGLEAQVAQYLNGSRIGHPIYAYQHLSSTMEQAHTFAQAAAAEGTLVVAARQERGRGRLGRVWESPEGGAYCSLILRPTRPTAEIAQLSLVAGLSVVEAIRKQTQLFTAIRWPNDVLIRDRKVAGILVEAKSNTVILGIGINVTTAADALPETGTSLVAEGALQVDPPQMIAAVCHHFETWYDVWTKHGFPSIRDALRPWIGLFGQPVKLTVGASQFEGIAHDLDESGRLVVRLDSGFLRPFEMGEVTLLR